nr:Protein F58H1.5 [Haemonchus contortus]
MACECLPPPPVFQLPPPPDLSLVWHLISDEPYEAPSDCEWSPFISISDVSSKIPLAPLSSRSLIVISLIALLILLSLIALVICRIRRGKSRRNKTKSASSDGILSAGDNVWTYNSMKNSYTGSMGILVCNGTSHNQAYQHTPGTIRSFATIPHEPAPLRPCTSTTLRLHPKEHSAAYHTVGRNTSSSPTEFYEEIPPQGFLPTLHHFHDGRNANIVMVKDVKVAMVRHQVDSGEALQHELTTPDYRPMFYRKLQMFTR